VRLTLYGDTLTLYGNALALYEEGPEPPEVGRLTLYGHNLTLYGNALALYGEGPEPPEVVGQSGGAWLPIIYLDRAGKPVDINAKIEKAVQAVPAPQRKEVAAVAKRMSDARWIVENDMADEAAILLKQLDKLDAFLADMIRQDIANEDDAIAILLLLN